MRARPGGGDEFGTQFYRDPLAVAFVGCRTCGVVDEAAAELGWEAVGGRSGFGCISMTSIGVTLLRVSHVIVDPSEDVETHSNAVFEEIHLTAVTWPRWELSMADVLIGRDSVRTSYSEREPCAIPPTRKLFSLVWYKRQREEIGEEVPILERKGIRACK